MYSWVCNLNRKNIKILVLLVEITSALFKILEQGEQGSHTYRHEIPLSFMTMK